MKRHIDTKVDDVVILQKKTTFQFILSEAVIYLSQIMVFFWVAFLISGSLSNEDKLIIFLESKIHDNSFSEVGHVILGTIITFGIILMIIRASPTLRWLEELSDDILASISRTIYFFGSSVTGSILTVALYFKLNLTLDNPSPESWLGLSVIFGVGAFIYGCGTSYAFKYKKYVVKSRPNKSKLADADKSGVLFETLENRGNSMASNFENIKIVSFDDKSTYKVDPSSALVNAVLKLSSSAPAGWADYFNKRWEQHFYMMKRNAYVSGDRLETCCVPNELQNLIVEFNKIIDETNKVYAQYWAQKQHEVAQNAAADAAERENLAKIKSSLKFN